MVFNGRPSAGCAICKQRKKKCDLTKPYCQQCLRANRDCPGIPNEVDLLFRNKFPNGASERSRPRQPLLNDHSLPTSTIGDNAQECCEAASSQIARAVPTDWMSTATTYYFNLHCQPYFFNLHTQRELDARKLNPWLELQSEFFTVSKPETGLNYAVQALAALTMAIDLSLPNLSRKAYTAYGCGLRAINTALSDSNLSKKNDVALGVFAMISFELKQQDQNFFQRYRTHCSGMKQLLILRGKEQLHDEKSLKVFRALRIQIICDHILRGEALNIEGNGSIWVETHPEETTPADSLWAVAARIPNLLATTKTSLDFQSSTADVLSDAMQLDSDLVNWLSQNRDDLELGLTVQKDHGRSFWQDTAYVFADLSTATLLNQYYFMRVQVLEVVMKLMKEIGDCNLPKEFKEYDALHQIHGLADSLCYSLPFITGQVRDKAQASSSGQSRPWAYPSHGEATWILMPIAIMAQQEVIEPGQKIWLRQQLNNLNADFGLIDAIPALRGQGDDASVSLQDHLSIGQ